MQACLQSDKFLLRPFLAEPGKKAFPRESFAHAIAHADIGIILRGASSTALHGSGEVLHFLCGACVGGPGTERALVVEPKDEELGNLAAQHGIPSLSYDPSAPLEESLNALCRQLEKGITELGSKK